jgi:hypothetical protein
MTFSYRRNLVPMLGVFIALAVLETGVVHILVAAWWGLTAAIVCGLVDLSLVVTLVALLRSIGRRPITLEGRQLTLHTGFLRRVEVDVGNIGGFRTQWSNADLKAPGVLNMGLIAWPNTVFDLERQVEHKGKRITAVAHSLDDPAGFRTAIDAARVA